MKIAIPHPTLESLLALHHTGGLITVGYALLAFVTIAALCLAAGQPGITQTEIAIATVLP